jgi:diaminopimelate epimerase
MIDLVRLFLLGLRTFLLMIYAFNKYQAIGNDYILFDAIGSEYPLKPQDAIWFCNRKLSIGADGILQIKSGEDDSYSLEIFNSNGSIANMCGNGLRCVIRYLYDNEYISLGQEVTINTRSGKRGGLVRTGADSRPEVEAGIGIPAVANDIGVMFEKDFQFVDVGNPHCVTFLESNEELVSLTLSMGPTIEKMVEGGINVGFAWVRDESNLELSVWERGAGFAKACGTGATAAVAAAIEKGYLKKSHNIMVHQPGGVLEIKVSENGEARISGEALKVFSGSITMELKS